MNCAPDEEWRSGELKSLVWGELALLNIVIDRLRSFQAGPNARPESELALAKLEEAQRWLQGETDEAPRL